MLILAKSILGLMLSFFVAVVFGYFLIPILKKLKCGQTISVFTAFRHSAKQGTPTIGGLIFIIPTLVAMLILYLRGSLEITPSLLIIIFVFISYALLGFVDDYLKIKARNNEGLSITQKLIIQVLIALIFFFIYMKGGGDTYLRITSLGINIDLKWFYGIFILFLLVGSSNAVNLTDGLDGLAGSLSVVAFLSFGILCWGTTWVSGNQEMAIFCFILVGALLGFLVYNTHPAKVFMGDTGSMALGSSLAAIAILSKHELSLAVIGGVFVIETLSTLIQIIAIRKFKKRVFKKAPLHHHFEECGWAETDIVRTFWVVGLILAMIMITYGVWL
jgi:phospho-N-acetylmuramoyl-pentapeptide-transferase